MYLNIYIQEFKYIHTIIGTGWRKSCNSDILTDRVMCKFSDL